MDKLITKEGRELRIERDFIDVSSLHEKDPGWCFIDKQGHEHRWYIPAFSNDWREQHFWRLSSLRKVAFVSGYEDGEPMYGVHYYCKKCGELIQPGYRPSPYRRLIPGPTQYYLDDEEVSRKEAETILKEQEKEG